jgi:hypothetical protein
LDVLEECQRLVLIPLVVRVGVFIEDAVERNPERFVESMVSRLVQA